MTTRRLLGGAAIAAALLALITGPLPAAHAADVRECTPSDLDGRVTSMGEGMSQPAAHITLTNTSTTACSVDGYPTMLHAATKTRRKAISWEKDQVMNAYHHTPRYLVVEPGRSVNFAVGAELAYVGKQATFHTVTFRVNAGGPRMTVTINLPASAEKGKPYPLGFTAYGRGISRDT